MSPKSRHESPTASPPSDRELQDARRLISMFILAWKNYGLYPEDHESTKNSIKNLVAAFSSFFAKHGDLRLTVEKDRLIYRSEMIHTVSQRTPSEDIIRLLYRDGIKWIEFQEGLSLGEIASFFRIAHKYRLFLEETEGDIVTALMDEELEYIAFKAVDIYWQDLMLMNFSQLPPPAPQPETAADQNIPQPTRQATESEERIFPARSIADPLITKDRLELSDTEAGMLKQMVKEEESWDITDDLFDLLLILLRNQTEQDKFAEVLEFATELAAETVKLAKFDLLVKLFRSLDTHLSLETSTDQDWKRLCIDRFFQDLSRPDVFQLISETLLQPQRSEPKNLEALEEALYFLSPAVVSFLVPLITQNSSPEIQQLVLRVIVQLSRRDLGPLEKISEQHSQELGDKLLAILKNLPGDRANQIIFRLCKHPSNTVRRKAIKCLLERDPKYTQTLFSLIDDPASEIRARILAAIAKHKSTELEKRLLNYLQENSDQKDRRHILACFRALGRCGSNRAVPFLGKILLSRGWNRFVGSGKPVFREGAAIALAQLDTPESKQVLRKASKSRFKAIRNAFDKTRHLHAFSRENIND